MVNSIRMPHSNHCHALLTYTTSGILSLHKTSGHLLRSTMTIRNKWADGLRTLNLMQRMILTISLA